jgi:tetratricopeptide (TPR) repeat protein
MKGFRQWIVLVSLVFCLSGGVQAADPSMAELDQLFAGRDEIQNLQKADALLSVILRKQPSQYEFIWRAARIKYYLAGTQREKSQKSRFFEEGMNLSRRAVEVEPSRPEGHFWLAANCGEFADLRGVWASLRLLSTIRQEFEKVLQIAPGFEQGKAYLALGEMKMRLPSLLGGDDLKGIQYLQEGLRLAPGNHELKVSLATAYLQKHREAEARSLLEQVLKSVDPSMTSRELNDVREQAQQKLSTLERRQ